MTTSLLALAAAFLAGAIPFGFLLVRLRTGADVRRSGSGNIGAANVTRTAGPAIGALTLALDALKGWFAVRLMEDLAGGAIAWMSAAALAAMLGHAFTPFLRFRGGKAVATFFGAWLYIAPLPGAAVLLVFIAVSAYSRHVSLGSVVAAGSFPFGIWMIDHPRPVVVLLTLACGLLVVLRHRDNIRRIREGTESTIDLRMRRSGRSIV